MAQIGYRLRELRREQERQRTAASSHASDAAVHVGALVGEALAGDIDGANRVFLSTYVPDWSALFLPMLWTRGGLTQVGVHYTQEGRVWWLASPPKTTTGFTDMRPYAVYLRDVDVSADDFDLLLWQEPSGAARRRASGDLDEGVAALL